jgi:hypothetical protein
VLYSLYGAAEATFKTTLPIPFYKIILCEGDPLPKIP